MRIDLQELRNRAKYINETLHPNGQLIIWNYSNACQFDGAWDEYTLMARGLITDLKGHVVARPFTKFFNLNSTPETMMENLPAEVPRMYEKLDGSLGILYFLGNSPFIATRGSFISDQAMWATRWLSDFISLSSNPVMFYKEFTYLFEIIYPDNRIVVDYGQRQELVLLAVINTQSGEELDIAEEGKRLGMSYAKLHVADFRMTAETMDELPGNEEGYVVRYSNGLRLKMKGAEYVRLHRLITGFSSKSIWECLMNGQNIEEMLEKVPDEFFDWVKRVQHQLEHNFDAILSGAGWAYQQVRDLPDRKTQAQVIMEKYKEISSLVFGLLDGRDISKDVWKRLKPEYELPFKKDIDQ